MKRKQKLPRFFLGFFINFNFFFSLHLSVFFGFNAAVFSSCYNPVNVSVRHATLTHYEISIQVENVNLSDITLFEFSIIVRLFVCLCAVDQL